MPLRTSALRTSAHSRDRRGLRWGDEPIIDHGALATVERKSGTVLRRACAAFGLDWKHFTFQAASPASGSVELLLSYQPADGGEPFAQRRKFGAHYVPTVRICEKAREHVVSMVWNVALLYRPRDMAEPSGWSIHPITASILKAAGTPLPNPADPRSWLARKPGKIHLPDGGNVADAVFSHAEGVLLLDSAKVLNAAGDVIVAITRDGPTMTLITPGPFPESVVDALAGQPATTLCGIFAASDHGTAEIAAAFNVPEGSSMHVELVDRLVPLLPTVRGRERWRPRTAGQVVVHRQGSLYKRLQHSASSLARRYAATAAPVPRPKAAAASGQVTSLSMGRPAGQKQVRRNSPLSSASPVTDSASDKPAGEP